MINNMIPWVDKNFRTLSGQEHRAMSGLSMGAMCTKSVTLAHLDMFSYIGLFSGGTIAPAEITDKSKVKLVFMSYGSRERGSEGVKAAADLLNQAGIKSASYVSPLTAHEWQSWRRSLRDFAMLLFKD
jgi:enterochelin esterase family protein